MYIAIDGNSTGKRIERMILEDKLDDLSEFSYKIQLLITEISAFICENGGKIIMAGGDNILAEISAASLEGVKDRISRLSFVDYSFSIAIADTAQGAYLGLKYAKANGYEMIRVVIPNNTIIEFQRE